MTGSEHNDDKTQTHVILTKGTMVSHYRIIEKIGAGGMGEVYLAQDTELDRKVALKFLPPHLCQDEDCRARFKREAQAAAKLSHPNIIHIYEVSEFHGRPFFAMEHIEGRSLRDMKGEELDIDRILGIAIQLCDGLQTAHAAGVIHRDIKPSNIVIDSSGRPKLLDFGLATVKGSEHLTKTGSTLGTVGYMSPEQIEGKATDARSDLFSLGVVLYELIANKSPFRRDDETATLKAILHDTPEPLARYKSRVPDDFQRIVVKLLEKDPSLRYQSASGVIPDLKKLSPSRTSGIAPEKKRDWWNRYIVSAAVAVLLILTAFWYFGDRGHQSREAEGKRIMLAVLPFKNLGNPEDEYFADGITEEIMSRLSSVSGLGVISSTSSFSYKGSSKTLPQIAQELGADYVLEGNIRWDRLGGGNRVNITPQLINASDDSHVWSQDYQRVVKDIFAVQGEIAEHVAGALGIALASSEREALDYSPTDNIEAYRHYLKGQQARHASRYREAEQELTEALRLEPDFAFAHAELARTLASASLYFPMESAKLQERAKEHGLRALELAPGLREAHLAMAYFYYRVHRDYDRALEEIAFAQENLPSNSEVFFLEGIIRRRQGLWDESLSLVNRAVMLDPLNPDYIETQKENCIWTRRYDEGLKFMERAISSQPDVVRYSIFKAQILSKRDGYSSAIGALVDSLRHLIDVTNPDYWSFRTIKDVAEFDILARDFDAALSKMSTGRPSDDDASLLPTWYMVMSEIHYFRKDESLSNSYADSAMELWAIALDEAKSEESVLWANKYLAWLSAMKGNVEDALAYNNAVLSSPLLSNDYLEMMLARHDMALVACRLGREDEALDYLDELLRSTSKVSVTSLRDHPDWDPLRDHPRFQTLLKKYGGDQAGI